MEGLDYLGVEESTTANDRFARIADPIDEEAAALRAADAEIERRNQMIVTALLGTLVGGVVMGVPVMTAAAVLGLVAYSAREPDKDNVERLLRTKAASQSPTLQSAQRQLTAARLTQIERQADDLTVLGVLQSGGGNTATAIAAATGLDAHRVAHALSRLASQGQVDRFPAGEHDDIPPPSGRPPFKLLPGGKDA